VGVAIGEELAHLSGADNTSLNDKGLTIVLVTHEHDIAQFAKRVLVFRDGRIRKDDPVLQRPRVAEVLKTLPNLED